MKNPENKKVYDNRLRKAMQDRRYKKGLCIKCGKNKLDTGKRYCRECLDEKKKWYVENREKVLASQKPASKKHNTKLKIEVLSHYSKEGFPKCQECGFENIKALSLDHINNDGAADRVKSKTKGGIAFYTWIKKNNFPEGLQCLCMNCQFIKIE